MNKEQIHGKSDQIVGKIKETWGRLTENDVLLYNGKREQFLGKLKELYGLSKEDAEKKLKTLEDAGHAGSSAAGTSGSNNPSHAPTPPHAATAPTPGSTAGKPKVA